MKMGSNASNCNSLDESDESEYHSLDSDMEGNDYLTSDAIYSKKTVELNKHLTSDDIQTIDKNLDRYDKVSLIYLLYDDDTAYTALQRIILLLHSPTMNILNEWYQYEKKQNSKCEYKLLEALTIIQNYEILKTLGYKKDEMIRFLPLQDCSVYVNRVRKCCYRICEDFNTSKTKSFLEKIEHDFNKKNMAYIPNEQKQNYHPEYLEMYFLYLETEKYIALDDVQNLAKIFKSMNFENLYDKFQDLHNKVSKKDCTDVGHSTADYNIDKTPGIQKSSTSNEEEVSYKVENNSMEYMNDVYDINPECPGTLLIINNEYFHTEYREEFKELLPKVDLKLESRTGSQSDKKKLEETFSKLGFEVITEENKIHEDMLKTVQDVAIKLKSSSLFVAILSHGDQGVVYGANSIAVEVMKIQQSMCQKHLSGKPKVLLLQSCQGSDCQTIDDDDYEVDSVPKKYTPPKTTDLLTFRATIPGYGAVRHRLEGSWFVQTLCKAIEKYPNDHIQEICRKVIAEVSGKIWKNKCMVPLLESTFTKNFYFKVAK